MTRRSRPMALLLTGALVAGSAGIASAHQDECIAQLRDVPLETLPAPSGFTWESFSWNGPSGVLDGMLYDSPPFGAVFVRLACSADPIADARRRHELMESLGVTMTRLAAAPVGDELLAYRIGYPDGLSDGDVYIEWVHGNISAEVRDMRSFESQDFGMLEQLAQDIEALLP